MESFVRVVEIRSAMAYQMIESRINSIVRQEQQRGYHLRDIKFISHEFAFLFFDKKVSSK